MKRTALLGALLMFSEPSLMQGRFLRHRANVKSMEATAFSVDGKPTTAGTVVHSGIVAADPAILPLGSRVRITKAGPYNGVYTVTETGSKVNGNHIDIYMPSTAEAKKFGKKVVGVQLLEAGEGKQDARNKDIPASR
jgi:rare lipoprotein A